MRLLKLLLEVVLAQQLEQEELRGLAVLALGPRAASILQQLRQQIRIVEQVAVLLQRLGLGQL